MGRLFLILTLFFSSLCMAQNHGLTIDDLLALSSLSSQNIDNYIAKKGFSVKRRSIIEKEMGFTFFEKKDPKEADTLQINRSVNLYKKEDSWCIALHTTSMDEFINGRNQLKGMNFIYDTRCDTCIKGSLLFQRNAITVEAICGQDDGAPVYTFLVKRKEIPNPGSIRYAEDLLKFDSHEYLVSCFGENNVRKDVYLFSEKESKKCSVLFPNSSEQAVFIWDEQNNYRKLSYILISGTISTSGSVQYSGSFSQNKWVLKNGIYPGMRIGDLLRLNSNDFKFYGNESEFSFMVEPKITGSINFKWIGIGLNCFNCDRSVVMDKPKVSATDAVNNNLALHVSYIMISR